ncbi:type IV secretory pathway VirB6 component (fragment) [Escherichia coli]
MTDDDLDTEQEEFYSMEGANKRGNTSRLTQSFHFFMFEPIFSPVNALNQPI